MPKMGAGKMHKLVQIAQVIPQRVRRCLPFDVQISLEGRKICIHQAFTELCHACRSARARAIMAARRAFFGYVGVSSGGSKPKWMFMGWNVSGFAAEI